MRFLKRRVSSFPQKASQNASQSLEQLEKRNLFSSGLNVSYYSDNNFQQYLGSGVDPSLNATLSPAIIGSPSKDFSASWNGQIKAKFSEYYQFFLQSNGGVRLYVNGALVIDKLSNDTNTEHAVKLPYKFLAGQSYDVRVDFVNQNDIGSIKLMYQSTRTTKQVIPTSKLANNSNALAAGNSINISFRPGGDAAPDGYYADNGKIFGNRGNGYSYGWSANNSGNMYDRNSGTSYGERYDSFGVLNPAGKGRSWEIALPNGTYNVRVVGGDATSVGSTEGINVEGVHALRGTLDSYDHWYDGTVTVTVTDGKLTVTGANNVSRQANKINFIQITPFDQATRLIDWRTIGYPGMHSPATRDVGQGAFANGWTGYVQQYIVPEIQAGVKRIVLHNPFGISADGAMVLDQFLLAKQAGLNWLTDDFVSAWKPITAAGVEVIAYVGTFSETPGFLSNDDNGRANVAASLQPMLDAGMSVALDAAVGQGKASLINSVAQTLRSQDVKVYVEARPELANPNWFNYPVISENGIWNSYNPDVDGSTSVWAPHNYQLTGEVVRWIQLPPAGLTWETSGWLSAEALGILQQGYTVAIPFDQLTNTDGVTISWLESKTNSAPPPAGVDPLTLPPQSSVFSQLGM